MPQSTNIDLADPRVQELLGRGPSLATGNRREVVQLAGDAPDPTGATGARGLQSTHRLTGGRQEVIVLYKDLLLTVDLYALPGEAVKAHLICPRCHNCSTVPGDQKRIEYDPLAVNPIRMQILEASRAASQSWERDALVGLADFGRLSIEAFECSWEMGNDRHVRGAVHTGGSLCRLRLVIEDNRAQDA